MADLSQMITDLLEKEPNTKVLNAVKASYPKFKEKLNEAPGEALNEMADYERVNPLGSALSFMGNVVAGKGARGFKQAESLGRVFGGMADALPRFEVADNAARLKSELPIGYSAEIWKKARRADSNILSDFLDHPALFEQYPELKNLRVDASSPMEAGKAAFYNADKNMIGIDPNLSGDMAKSTLLHEIQHAIQKREGFKTGMEANESNLKDYLKNPGEVEARAVEQRMRMNPEALEASPIKDFIEKMQRMQS